MHDHDQIFENINLGLIILDRDLIVRAWNRWMELHSSIPLQKIQGASILDFYPHLAGTAYRRFFKSVLSFGNYAFFSQKLHKHLIPMKNPHHSAGHLPLMQQNCTAGPIRDEHNNIISIYITVQDVTEYVVYEHKLIEMSRLDPMTMLLNRSHLERGLMEDIKRSERFGTALSVMMIDIDLFKTINDTHGHLCGDRIICQVAALIKETVRQVDIVGRYGGEEFCCILPETSAGNACVIAERLRETVEKSKLGFEGQALQVTVSLGIAEYGGACDTLETLIKAADDALYVSKRSGRNRVTCSHAKAPVAVGTGIREPLAGMCIDDSSGAEIPATRHTESEV
jgi:diguanylate cyclase (GGDEF)-like protein